METCSKKYVDSSFGYSIGKPIKVQCQKPVKENGLCAYHFEKSISKQAHWGDRHNYREATQDDLDKNRSLKLKDTSRHRLFRFRKGKIEENKKEVWTATEIEPDFNLFCVKI